MWPIGGSSCDRTLNPKAFGMLPVRVENASIGALKTEKKKKTNTNLIRPWLRYWPKYIILLGKEIPL